LRPLPPEMIRFRVLGPISLSRADGQPLDEVVAQPRRLALLVYLAIQAPRGFTRRDALLPIFWPELDQDRARGALRQALYVLRSALGDGVVISRGTDEVALAPDRVSCDAIEFERACDERRWAEAVELYGGDFLQAFFIKEAPQFEQWAQERQGRLRLRMAAAAQALAAAQEKAGLLDEAIATARRSLIVNASDEQALRLLLTLLDRQGDRAGAAREYDAFVARLADEFGVAPSAETVAVMERVRNREDVRPDHSSGNGAVESPVPVGGLTTRSPAPRPARSWIFVRPGWVVAAVVLLAGFAAFRFATQRLSAADPPDRVAVLPFEVRGDAEHDYLRDALVDLLSRDLDGAGGIQTIDPNAVRATGVPVAPTPAQGQEIARQLGARYFVVGSAVIAGAKLRVHAELFDLKGEEKLVAAVSRDGTSEQLFEIADGVAADILASAQRAPDVRMSKSAAMTTRSLPALKAYLEGEQAFQRGDQRRSAEALRRAVTIDSTFALASYRLSIVVDAMSGAWTEITETAQRAMRHGARLSERDQLLLKAHFASVAEDVGGAERQYRAIVARYPDEMDAWYRLAELIFHQNPITGRSVVDAREPFERLLALDPSNRAALQHLARIAAVQRRAGEVDTLYQRVAAAGLVPTEEFETRAIRVFTSGSPAERERFIRDFGSAPPGGASLVTWVMNVFVRDLDATRRLLEVWERSSRDLDVRVSARGSYARIFAARGQMDSADAKVRQKAALDSISALEQGAFLAIMPFRSLPDSALLTWRRRVADWKARRADASTLTNNSVEGPWQEHERFYLLGQLDALLRDSAAVRADVEALERLPVPSLPDAQEFARELAASVRAHLLWRQGNVRAALALIERTPSARPYHYRNAFSRVQNGYVRAELLLEEGRNAEALRWYGSFDYNDLKSTVFAVPAHFRRGQILERLGEPAQAAAHYREFLDYWRNADASLRSMTSLAEARLREISAAAASSR
jgi:DNA-binding SARP family transcriptional activator/TolB-like protein